MPKVQLTVSNLIEFADHVYQDNLKALRIARYKSGKNKGSLFIDYIVDEEAVFNTVNIARRQHVCNVMKTAAQAMADGRLVDLSVTKGIADYGYSVSMKPEENAQ